MNLYILGFSLLLFIPGIVVALSYTAVPYLLAVKPHIKPGEVLKLSKNIMDGHKEDLFDLMLSIIHWQILSIPFGGIFKVIFQPYAASLQARGS